MRKKRRRVAKLAMSAAVLGAGVLPGTSCAMRFRDAAWNGVGVFTTNTVVNALSAIVPINSLLGI